MSCHDHLNPVDLNRISAVSILSGEHQVILQSLSCLERVAAKAARERRIPIDHARQLMEVFTKFADTCHHQKEEEILFPALEALEPGFGPTQVMRAEHVEGRAHIKAMGIAVETGNIPSYVEHAVLYVELLRQHIAKEDEVLFCMAQSMIGSEQDAILVEAYRRMEHDDMKSGTHERLLGIADSLADAYEVPWASADPVIFTLLTACCGCHTSHT